MRSSADGPPHQLPPPAQRYLWRYVMRSLCTVRWISALTMCSSCSCTLGGYLHDHSCWCMANGQLLHMSRTTWYPTSKFRQNAVQAHPCFVMWCHVSTHLYMWLRVLCLLVFHMVVFCVVAYTAHRKHKIQLYYRNQTSYPAYWAQATLNRAHYA